jgi:hypothetical protein
MSDRRATLVQAMEVALVVAFLALSTLAYGAFFVEAGYVMTASVPTQFSSFYQPGQNPWSGPVIAPTAPEEQVARKAPTRSRYR